MCLFKDRSCVREGERAVDGGRACVSLRVPVPLSSVGSKGCAPQLCGAGGRPRSRALQGRPT